MACARKGRFRCALSAINTAIANLVAAVQAFEEANKGTGISVVKAATGKEVWYDMNGRRVAQPTKGGGDAREEHIVPDVFLKGSMNMSNQKDDGGTPPDR